MLRCTPKYISLDSSIILQMRRGDKYFAENLKIFYNEIGNLCAKFRTNLVLRGKRTDFRCKRRLLLERDIFIPHRWGCASGLKFLTEKYDNI